MNSHLEIRYDTGVMNEMMIIFIFNVLYFLHCFQLRQPFYRTQFSILAWVRNSPPWSKNFLNTENNGEQRHIGISPKNVRQNLTLHYIQSNHINIACVKKKIDIVTLLSSNTRKIVKKSSKSFITFEARYQIHSSSLIRLGSLGYDQFIMPSHFTIRIQIFVINFLLLLSTEVNCKNQHNTAPTRIKSWFDIDTTGHLRSPQGTSMPFHSLLEWTQSPGVELVSWGGPSFLGRTQSQPFCETENKIE